jgi:hypothetical protein
MLKNALTAALQGGRCHYQLEQAILDEKMPTGGKRHCRR